MRSIYRTFFSITFLMLGGGVRAFHHLQRSDPIGSLLEPSPGETLEIGVADRTRYCQLPAHPANRTAVARGSVRSE